MTESNGSNERSNDPNDRPSEQEQAQEPSDASTSSTSSTSSNSSNSSNSSDAPTCTGKQVIPAARQIPWYGWRRQLPDHRDRPLSLKVHRTAAKIPKTVNLEHRGPTPPVYDQGALGSCTANAIAAAFEFDARRQHLVDFIPSRLAIYWGERVIEHTVNEDAGAEIRDGMKVLAKTGAASEALWPYDIPRFTQTPSQSYFAEAAKHLCTVYEAVPQDEAAIKSVVAQGYPVVFGFSVYDAFESEHVATTGTLNMPKAGESLLGGHAVAVWGYTGTRVRVRNSWGADWGQEGYFSMPWDYILNPDLASDFWMIRTVQ